MGRIVGVAVLTAACLASSASAGSVAGDRPVIVPWHQIGGAGLGMVRASVDSRYGPGAGSSRIVRVPGGHLFVGYAGNQVSSVSTDSSRYETPDGIGVGTTMPRARRW